MPIIDEFTELKFSVQDLQIGNHIKDLHAHVTVATTDGSRLFQFKNITAADGDFSVKYNFPDDGTHLVILQVDSADFAALASFKVFVPHQSAPTLLNPFPPRQEAPEASIFQARFWQSSCQLLSRRL